MKKRNGKLRTVLAMTCCALLLVSISVGVTIAYLTDDDAVTNTFTVGQVGISLNEEKVTADGKPVQGAGRVQANTYHLIPGQTYTKDPTVHLDAKSESAYVRMIVTVEGYNDLLSICEHHDSNSVVKPQDPEEDSVVLLQNFTDWKANVWEYKGFSYDYTKDAATYEFRYHQVTDKKDGAQSLEPLFSEITLPGYMTNLDLEVLESEDKGFGAYPATTNKSYDSAFKITVVAHAIQAAGFDDANAAWEAFDNQMAQTNN